MEKFIPASRTTSFLSKSPSMSSSYALSIKVNFMIAWIKVEQWEQKSCNKKKLTKFIEPLNLFRSGLWDYFLFHWLGLNFLFTLEWFSLIFSGLTKIDK